jgi:hypothetical protein
MDIPYGVILGRAFFPHIITQSSQVIGMVQKQELQEGVFLLSEGVVK